MCLSFSAALKSVFGEKYKGEETNLDLHAVKESTKRNTERAEYFEVETKIGKHGKEKSKLNC